MYPTSASAICLSDSRPGCHVIPFAPTENGRYAADLDDTLRVIGDDPQIAVQEVLKRSSLGDYSPVGIVVEFPSGHTYDSGVTNGKLTDRNGKCVRLSLSEDAELATLDWLPAIDKVAGIITTRTADAFYNRAIVDAACTTCGAKSIVGADDFRSGNVPECQCRGGSDFRGSVFSDGWLVVDDHGEAGWMALHEDRGLARHVDAEEIIENRDYEEKK